MIVATTSAAKAAAAPIHMCQISANPHAALSIESTKPAPVFFGMWIGRKPSSGRT